MVIRLPKFDWCVARFGGDGNWWVKEVSEDINWDDEVPSFLSPDQVQKLLKQSKEELEAYGISIDTWNKAFHRFKIDKRLDNQHLRLVCTEKPLQHEQSQEKNESKGEEGESKEDAKGKEEPLFALPNQTDENDSPYFEFLDALIEARVAFLNDRIDFVQKLTSFEVKQILQEMYDPLYFEGRSLHVFQELSDILGYIPWGFELSEKK